MAFSFGQVVEALGAGHEVDPDRRTAFASRLKYYQRAGFPIATKTGRGKAATYEVEHVIKIAVLLEMNQMGISPDRALWILRLDLYRVRMAIRMVLYRYGEVEAVPMFLKFDPGGLDDLKHPTSHDAAEASFDYVSLPNLVDDIRNWGAGDVRRIAIINVTLLLRMVFDQLQNIAGSSLEDLTKSAWGWVDSANDPDDAIDELTEYDLLADADGLRTETP